MLNIEIALSKIKTHTNIFFLKMTAKYAPFPYKHL